MRFALEFFPGTVLYLVLLFASSDLAALVPSQLGKAAIALLPILGVLWMAVATIRHIRRSDEYQKKLALLASGFGFAAAMCVAVGVALVGSVGIDTTNSEWLIFGTGMVVWGAGTLWAGTR